MIASVPCAGLFRRHDHRRYRISAIDTDRRRSSGDVRITNQDGTLVAVGTHILKWVKNQLTPFSPRAGRIPGRHGPNQARARELKTDGEGHPNENTARRTGANRHGAARGIGLGIARLLNERGAKSSFGTGTSNH